MEVFKMLCLNNINFNETLHSSMKSLTFTKVCNKKCIFNNSCDFLARNIKLMIINHYHNYGIVHKQTDMDGSLSAFVCWRETRANQTLGLVRTLERSSLFCSILHIK
jgi:hypothetical protein